VSEPENIQCFNAAARAVLVLLYQQFPKPVAVDSSKLLAELPEYCRKDWGPYHGSDNMVAATVRFLRDEGYLRHSGEGKDRQTLFPGTVLTSKGFATLQRPLTALSESGPSLGSRLAENLSVGDLSAVISGLLQAGGSFIS